MFTIEDIMRLYGVSRTSVTSWINSGALQAIDVAPAGGKSRQFRVSAEALAAFESARSNRPSKPPRQPLPPVKSYV